MGPLPPSGWILGLWGELGPGEGQEGACVSWETAEGRTGPFPEQVCVLTGPNPPSTPATLW